MTGQQIARLEYLNSIEFTTPDEEAELRHLLRMQSEMRQAFETLRERNAIKGFRFIPKLG